MNAPTGALAVGKPGSGACDFGAMTKAARDYVGASDVIVRSLIPAMQTAYNNGGSAPTTAATPAALDILEQIAKERLTSAQVGTNAQGATLVNAVIAASCSDIQVGVSSATKTEFNAEKALAGGVFEVRGGASALAAVAFGPVTGGGRAQANPLWGITPATGCAVSGACSWPSLSVAQPRYLLTAYPTTAELGGETAVITTALGTGNNGFVVGMMPDTPAPGNPFDKSQFLVGICITRKVKDQAGNVIGGNFGLHANALLAPTTSNICDADYPVQTLLESSPSWFASLTHKAASWLSPSLLFAQDRSFDGGDWVGPTGWSPITFAQVTGTGTFLNFVNTPKTGTVAHQFELQVLVTSASKHPVQGATVTVSLANNSGVPAGAEIIGGPYVTSEPTKEDGIAHLSLAVNKAGGYTFYATAVLSLGGATNSAFSTTVLNIKNAKP